MHVGCRVAATTNMISSDVKSGDRGVVVEDLLFGWWRVEWTNAEGTYTRPVMHPREIRELHPLEQLAEAAEE